MHRRTRVLLALVLVGVAGCSSAAEPDTRADGTPSAAVPSGPVALEAVEEGPLEGIPSALDDADDPALPAPRVDPGRIISGGPPPDGIPPIDAPLFEPAASVDWLADDEPVIALELGEERRAYPVQIMHWHEIVNDTVGGRPVAVTYCPLCNSALAFDRHVGDRLVSFGTSGRLYLSALVMYDRQTESLWSQVERTAIAGALTGTELDLVPVTMLRWADWQATHPDGWVLSRETGHVRDYGRNPYVGYDELENDPFLLDQEADGRFPAKEPVVAFPDAADPVAILTADLADVGVAAVQVDGEAVVLFSSPGLASALDTQRVADGTPVAATGAFRPQLDGRTLTFGPVPDAAASSDGGPVAVDEQTGSRWNLLGHAVDGPLAGSQLDPVPHLNTFWFAQAAFRPETTVLRLASVR